MSRFNCKVKTIPFLITHNLISGEIVLQFKYGKRHSHKIDFDSLLLYRKSYNYTMINISGGNIYNFKKTKSG